MKLLWIWKHRPGDSDFALYTALYRVTGGHTEVRVGNRSAAVFSTVGHVPDPVGLVAKAEADCAVAAPLVWFETYRRYSESCGRGWKQSLRKVGTDWQRE